MTVDFNIYTENSQIGGITEFSQYETVYIVPGIEGRLVDTQYNIIYSVEDPEGVVLPSATYGFTYATDVDNIKYIIELDKLGDYTCNITINDITNGLTSTYTRIISTSEFITFQYTQCDSFTMNNNSSSKNITYVITDLEDNEVIPENILLAGTSDLITFESAGLYLVKVTYEDLTSYTYVLNTFCMLDDCLSKFILDLLCEDTRDCTCEFEPSSMIRIIRMFSLKETYFMKLQAEYGFNNKYSALTDSKLNELTTINQVLSKLAMMCDRTYCLEGGCAGVVKNIGTNINTGCGCS